MMDALPGFVTRIVAEVGLSHGYFVRRFTEQIVLSPKTSTRVLRFQRALGMLTHGNASLAETPAACGFFDQAHLNREFRALAGTTPSRLLATRRSEGALALDSHSDSRAGSRRGR